MTTDSFSLISQTGKNNPGLARRPPTVSESSQDTEQDPGLQALLARMKEAGQTGDEGVFSLDPDWVRKALNRFVLPVPDKYVLHAVASAVGAGATEVTVTVTSGKTVITHDGKHPSPQELQNLFNFLLVTHDAEKVYLRELAIAANNARYARTHLKIITADSVCEVDRAGNLTTHDKSSSGPFCIEFTRNRLMGWFMEVEAQQKKMLRANCEWSPARMVLDQSPLGTTFDLKHCALWATFGQPTLRLPAALDAVTFEFPSTASGFVCLGNETGFRIVARGVSYRLHGVVNYGGAYVVVQGDHLPFDVTGDQLQHGPQMDELVAEALKACDRAVLQYLRTARLGGADTLDHLAKLFARREYLPEPQRVRMEALTLETNRGPMMLGELWNQIKLHGHLLWSTEDVGTTDRAPVLVLQGPPPSSFDDIFNTIEFQETNHRLEDEICLVKIPGPNGGEWGILESPPKQKEESIFPAEVVWSGPGPEGMLHELRDDLDRLYQALLLTQPVDQIQSHLLSYFKAVVDERETPFSESAAEYLRFRRADGETVTLSDLRRRTTPLKGEVFGTIPTRAPDLLQDTLLLSPAHRLILPKLLEIPVLIEEPIFSTALRQSLKEVGQKPHIVTARALLEALAHHGATEHLLQGIELSGMDKESPNRRTPGGPTFSPEFQLVFELAEQEALRDIGTLFLTHHFLIALLRTEEGLPQRLGLDLERLRNIHNAKYREALESYSDCSPSALIHFRKAQVHYRNHQIGECLEECQTALDLNPYLSQAHYRKALCHAARGELDDALVYLESARELVSDSSYGRDFKIHVLLDAKRYEEAKFELAECPEDDRRYFALRATLALISGDPQKARDLCLQALENNTGPLNERALETLALALDCMGRYGEAKRAYRDFVRKSDQFTPEYRLYERIEEARRRLQELEAQYPET